MRWKLPCKFLASLEKTSFFPKEVDCSFSFPPDRRKLFWFSKANRKNTSVFSCEAFLFLLEKEKGCFEPGLKAWRASILPLDYTRTNKKFALQIFCEREEFVSQIPLSARILLCKIRECREKRSFSLQKIIMLWKSLNFCNPLQGCVKMENPGNDNRRGSDVVCIISFNKNCAN